MTELSQKNSQEENTPSASLDRIRKRSQSRKVELSEPSYGRRAVFVLLLFIFPLLIRLVYLFEIHNTPFFQHPVIDESIHYSTALSIQTDFLQNQEFNVPYMQPPLYPYLLSFFMKIFGNNVTTARMLNVLIGSGSVVLVFFLALRLFRKRSIAWGSYIATSLYPYLIYADSELLSTSLEIFLLLLFVYLFIKYKSKIRTRLIVPLVLGALMGCLISAKPSYQLFVFLFVPVALLMRWFPWKQMLLFCAFTILLIAPFTVRNYVVSKEFCLVSANGGINFYLGNNPNFIDTVAIRPGPRWYELQREPQKENINLTTERDDYFFDLGLQFMKNDPALFVKNLLKKGTYFVNNTEALRDNNIHYFIDRSYLLKTLMLFPWYFALIQALSVFGLVELIKSRFQLSHWGIVLTIYLSIAAVNILFFPISRYRMPLAPIFIILSAYGIARILLTIKTRRFRPRFLAASGASASMFLASILMPIPPWYVNSISTENLLGVAHLQSLENPEQALVHFQNALKENDKDPDNYYWAAKALDALGKKKEEIELLETAVKKTPGYSFLHCDLGLVYAQMGNFKRAEEELLKSIEISPYQEVAYINLAQIKAAKKDPRAAIEYMESAMELSPLQDDLYDTYGKMLLDMGQILEFEALLKRWKENIPNSSKQKKAEEWWKKMSRGAPKPPS